MGHSNTTPELVEALDGDAVSPIDEAEYDLLRFGVGVLEGERHPTDESVRKIQALRRNAVIGWPVWSTSTVHGGGAWSSG